MTPHTLAKSRESLFATHWTLYISVVLITALFSYAVWLRTRSIFACPADGYGVDRYIAYCGGVNYSDYEHGAFLFALEPTLDYANKADVLFFGNSRMQQAFSTTATADWFSAASARYYLMGFGYGEGMTFAEVLLRKMDPRASVYVINVDDFFDPKVSSPGKVALYDPMARSRYEGKRFWQRVQQRVCKSFSELCGSATVIFRSRETGRYDIRGMRNGSDPISFDEAVAQNEIDRDKGAAIDFLKQFTQGKCVILTLVPYVGTKIGDANAIAAALGTKLVTPALPEGLKTGDGTHLDRPSAERWSQAFFQAAGPEIRSCIEKHGMAASLATP